MSLDTRMQAFLLHFVLASFVFLSSIRDGSAGITSSFVRSEWPSVDIPLNHEAFAVPKGYNAPQQVSLTKIITRLILLLMKTLMRIPRLSTQIGHVKQFYIVLYSEVIPFIYLLVLFFSFPFQEPYMAKIFTSSSKNFLYF